MGLFNEEIKKQLVGILAPMRDRVNLLYFTQEFECGGCRDTRLLLEEFTSLSDKIGLTVFDLVKDREKAAYYKVDKIPATVFLDSRNNDTRIRFFGIPGGYEINSFVKSLLEVSGIRELLPDALRARIARIHRDIHVQVFVSLT
jgi:alkyl hydroperoxide reductase subunit AhpF